jgi:hypothetical protein
MSLNRQTPHFLRLETKRYRFFLGYGFQDLDGQADDEEEESERRTGLTGRIGSAIENAGWFCR